MIKMIHKYVNMLTQNMCLDISTLSEAEAARWQQRHQDQKSIHSSAMFSLSRPGKVPRDGSTVVPFMHEPPIIDFSTDWLGIKTPTR